jgi:hypothetical protein
MDGGRLMSDWTNFRDGVVKTLNFDTVTEEMKDTFSRWLLQELFPALKEPAETFCTQTIKQAENEKGWTKVRDLIILPFIVRFGLWAIEKSLEKCAETG